MATLFLSPAINLSLVSFSPVIIVHWCRDKFIAAITENPLQEIIAAVNDTGDKYINKHKGIQLFFGKMHIAHFTHQPNLRFLQFTCETGQILDF
jgi:hypothetical protein